MESAHIQSDTAPASSSNLYRHYLAYGFKPYLHVHTELLGRKIAIDTKIKQSFCCCSENLPLL